MEPRDQRAVETRDDVLVYSTPVLDRPVEVTGPIELRLFVASSARDTDFTGKLVDVYPDGRAMILTEGILRARYRTSLTVPELLEGGGCLTAHRTTTPHRGTSHGQGHQMMSHHSPIDPSPIDEPECL